MSVRSFRTSSIRTGEKRSKFWDQSAVVLNPAFESIASTTLSSNTTAVTFNSIPQTYQHLQIRALFYTATNNSQIYLNLNNNISSSNCRNHSIQGYGSSVVAQSNAGVSSFGVAVFGQTSSVTSPTYPVALIIDFHDYANTTRNKTVRFFGGLDSNNSSGAIEKQIIELGSVGYFDTQSISTISFNGFGVNLSAGTTVSLYGIKAAA